MFLKILAKADPSPGLIGAKRDVSRNYLSWQKYLG
jgi:hypothetical protein